MPGGGPSGPTFGSSSELRERLWAEKGPADMAKQSVSAVTPELQLSEPAWTPARVGLGLAAAGAATIWLAGTTVITGEPEQRLSLAMLGLVTLWGAGFVLCYGLRALQTGALPFLLLLFMVPFPPAVLTAIIVFLQKA